MTMTLKGVHENVKRNRWIGSLPWMVSVVLAALIVGSMVVFDTLRPVPPVQAKAPATQAATPPPPTLEATSNTEAIDDALRYIATQQDSSGGIVMVSSFNPENIPDADTTCRAVLAFAAAGYRPDSISNAGNTMLDYLRAQASDYIYDTEGRVFPSRAGLLLAAVVAADEDPTSFNGINLVETVQNTYNTTGTYSTDAVEGFSSGAPSVITQFWAIMGLSMAGEDIPQAATDYLINAQADDGGWGFGAASDKDTTAYAVVGLLASGNVAATDSVIQDALTFFRTNQLPNGGWQSVWDTTTNADTTGWVIQALLAAGHVPPDATWATDSGDPREALLAIQHIGGANDGAIGGDYVNAFSTAEAVYGLVDMPLFFLSPEKRIDHALAWLAEQQNDDGSWNGFAGPDAGATIDALLAYAAAGYDPATVSQSGNSPVDYLEQVASSYSSQSAASAGKLLLAVVTAGEDPRQFNSVDLIDVFSGTLAYDAPSDLWYYGTITNTYHQAYAILGLVAANEVPSATLAITALISLQDTTSGGWKYDDGVWSAISADDTGLALQALAAVADHITDTNVLNQINTSIANGLAYLDNSQNEGAGWSSWGEPACDSTAYAIQGLLAAGENPIADRWQQDNHTPYHALRAFQKTDGPFVYAWNYPNDNLMSTSKAVPALLDVHNALIPTAVLSPGALVEYTPIANRGLDADRLVAGQPRASWRSGGGVDVVVPFASDLNGNGTVTEIAWKPLVGEGNTDWISSTDLFRASDGSFYTATITADITSTMSYQFRATFSDPDGVQSGTTLHDGQSDTPVQTWGVLGVEQIVVNPFVSATSVVTLTYQNTSESYITLVVPTGAVEQPTTFLYTPAPEPGGPYAEHIETAWSFHLHTATGDGQLSQLTDATELMTITTHYADSEVGTITDGSLGLYAITENTVTPVDSMCGGQNIHNMAEQWVEATVCDLSNPFALLVEGSEAVLTPGTPITTTLEYHENGGYVRVVIPPDAVTQTTRLRLTPVFTLTENVPVFHLYAGWSFLLSGKHEHETNGADLSASSFTFARPISITVHYRDSDVRVVKEGSLRLGTVNNGLWSNVTDTCSPPTTTSVDSSGRLMQTEGCGIGRFALLNRGMQVRVDPALSGSAEFTYVAEGGGSLTLSIPHDAVVQAVDIVYTPMLSPTRGFDEHAFAGWAFALNAFLDNQVVPDLQLSEPAFITIQYEDDDVEQSGDNQLKLYYLNTSTIAWQNVATTCSPAGVSINDPERNRLQVAFCHLSDYATFNDTYNRLYLPLVRR